MPRNKINKNEPNKLLKFFQLLLPLYEPNIAEIRGKKRIYESFLTKFAADCGATTDADEFQTIYGVQPESMCDYFSASGKHHIFFGKTQAEAFHNYFMGKDSNAKDYISVLKGNLTKRLTVIQQEEKAASAERKSKNGEGKTTGKSQGFILQYGEKWKNEQWVSEKFNQLDLYSSSNSNDLASVIAEQFRILIREKIGTKEAVETVTIKATDFPASVIFNEAIYSDDIEIADLVKEKRHVAITGEGGLGKTTFLEGLISNSYFKAEFKNVYLISLAGLATSAKATPITSGFNGNRFETRDSSYIGRELYSRASFDVRNFFKEEDDPYLLLLDGLNELYENSDSDRVDEILNEIKYLSEETPICIVLTSRTIDDDFLGIHSFGFIKTTITGTPEEIIKAVESKGYSQKITELIKIPMYFIMFEKLEHTGNLSRETTKYSLLEHTWEQLFSQSSFAENDAKKALYYCFVPELAQYMVNNRSGLEISAESAADFFDSVPKSVFKPLLSANGCSTERVNALMGAEIVRMMQAENIVSSGDTVKFIHQDWREFLAAFSLKNKFDLIVKYYKNSGFKAADMPLLNLNVPNTVTEMFLEAMGIKADIAERCIGILSKLQELDPSDRVKSTADEKDIVFVEALCQLTECIPANTKNGDYAEIYSRIQDCLRELIDKVFFYTVFGISQIHSERTVQLFVNIIIKQSELLRNRTMYKSALEYITYGKDIVDCDSMKLRNQEGKVYMYYAQSCYRGEPIKSDEKLDLAVADAFIKGMNIIRGNARKHNNMSSNLLAMIESTPAPFIRQNHLAQIDYVKAFWTYFDVMNGNHSGKELVYSLRQCAALLIKGYVKVDEESKGLQLIKKRTNRLPLTDIDFFKDEASAFRNCVTLACDQNGIPRFDPENLNPSTLLLAESLLEKIRYETTDPYVSFLIGCVELAKGNKDVARSFLLKSGNAQAKIILYHCFGEYVCTLEECMDSYYAMKLRYNDDVYGRIDACHISYPIMETERLFINYGLNIEQEKSRGKTK